MKRSMPRVSARAGMTVFRSWFTCPPLPCTEWQSKRSLACRSQATSSVWIRARSPPGLAHHFSHGKGSGAMRRESTRGRRQPTTRKCLLFPSPEIHSRCRFAARSATSLVSSARDVPAKMLEKLRSEPSTSRSRGSKDKGRHRERESTWLPRRRGLAPGAKPLPVWSRANAKPHLCAPAPISTPRGVIG